MGQKKFYSFLFDQSLIKYWVIIFLVGVFILFKRKIDMILTNRVVDPFLSFVYPPRGIFDIIIVVAVFIGVISFADKLVRSNISHKFYWFCCTVCWLIYLSYRIPAQPFAFTSFYILKEMKLLDAIFAIPILARL